MNQQESYIIVGGGLCGLTLAYLLSTKNISATLLEASSRLGGRIQTVKGNNQAPLELGATWFSGQHQNLLFLLNELGLEKFQQFTDGKTLVQSRPPEAISELYVPDDYPPTYRVAGGTASLIDSLSRSINVEQVKLNRKVNSIKDIENQLYVESVDGEVSVSDNVIVCLPPQLISSQILFTPKLSTEIATVLPTVQTWMAGSMKFALEYSTPFWRENGYSGMFFSQSGIIREIHDHSNYEEDKFGFTGFLNLGSSHYSREMRKQLVVKQLEEVFGEKASDPITYIEKIWNDEFVLDGNSIINIPHHNNGHPVLQKTYMNNKLHFSGTETAQVFSGYMEGAVLSAMRTFEKLL